MDCAEHKECESCESRRFSPFCQLGRKGLDIIDRAKSDLKYKKNQVLFDSSQVPKGLYCVRSGTVSVERVSPNGQAHTLRIVGAGGIVGYRSLFDNSVYNATAIAREETQVCLIPKQTIHELFVEFPTVAISFLSSMSNELQESENRMVSVMEKSAHERIAEAVLYLKENHDDHRWTRREIAEWAGTTPETVMRTLAVFESESLVELNGREIVIADKDGLLKRANPSL